MANLLNEIIQALNNLGGQATLGKIYTEVERITKSTLSRTWPAKVRQTIEYHSSDSKVFKGKDYFHRVGKGTWALRTQAGVIPVVPIKQTAEDKKPRVTSSPETFEAISNYLRTMKEYREFYDPISPSWIHYIRDFFHILSFSTDMKDSRIILLTDMGREDATKAVVGYLYPGENFEQIIPNLGWDTYLSFAASYYHVEWGILTNGLRMKISNYGDRKDQTALSWSDLDGIIKNEKVDSFFPLYKLLSLIKGGEIIELPATKLRKAEKRKRASSQLPPGLLNILDVCNEMAQNGGDYTDACRRITIKNGLSSPHTVPDACTRRIGLNTAGFLKLYADKSQLINYLITSYPSYVGEISKTLSTSS